MRTDYLRIGPDLDVWVTWSSRMNKALGKRFQVVMYGPPGGHEHLRSQYDRWCRSRDGAYDQIHRFFTLTNSLPVAGDCLLLGGRDGGGGPSIDGGEDLYIEKRLMYSSPDSPTILLVYEVRGDDMEELEEHQEGDYIEADE